MTRFPRKRIKKCCLDRVCAVCDKYNTWDLSMLSGDQALWRPRCMYTANVTASIGKWEVEEKTNDTINA